MEKKSTTVFVHKTLTGLGGAFSVDIRCPFTPKTVTVSNVIYLENDVLIEPGISLLSTNLISSIDGVIGSFLDGMGKSSPMTFICNGPVNGQIEFRYTTPTRTGDLAFALTFQD